MARQRKTEGPDPILPDDPESLGGASIAEDLPQPTTEPAGSPHHLDAPRVDEPPPARQGARAWPLVLGGMIAAAAGGAATVAVVRTYPGLVVAPSASNGVEQRLADHDLRIAGLDERIEALPTATAPAAAGPSAEELLLPLQDRFAAIDATLAAVAGRVKALEQRPPAAAAATVASPDIAAAAAALKEAEESARALKAEAAALARQAAIAQSLARIEAALETGSGLTDGLEGLRAAGAEMPEALVAVEQGAPTLKALRDAFPEAAREAIALSLAAAPQPSVWGRLSAFLRAQTGARSLSPRAGDDPDAILSRAEAALGANDLASAIAEIATLPTEGQGRMQEWATLATRRLAATDALQALRAEVQP